jgi:uncharacterized membrane protein
MVIEFIHPIVVHFPIALLIVSVIFAFGWLFSGAAWWRNTLLILVTLGAAGAFFAMESGEELREHEFFEYGGFGDLEPLMDEHEELGEASMFVAMGTAVFLLGVFAFGFKRGSTTADPIALRVIGLVATLACAATVGIAGHRGGLLVWGEVPDEGSGEGAEEAD